jgi:ADP-dependent NAD(P)H-hydrate dehydratase / NAD(P)H-hydrate epimerase
MTLRSADTSLLTRWVRKPLAGDHKYSRGVVGFATGSLEYPGAALIGVSAALHTGVGMVRYQGPEVVQAMVVTSHPEVVIAGGEVDAWVVGSGMASPLTLESVAMLRVARDSGAPVVVDAGALERAEDFGPLAVLTPHEGELRALGTRLGVDQSGSPLELAVTLAQMLNQCIVAKGSITRVVNPAGDVWELPTATPWLATAGTGDALAGIMGALCATWHDSIRNSPEVLAEVAVTAALIHQTAAAHASWKVGFDADAPSGGPFSVMDVCREVSGVIARVLSES